MHVVIMITYGFTLWTAALAYAVITGEWKVSTVLYTGPLIISGGVALLTTVDSLWWALGAKRRDAMRRLDALREAEERQARRIA
ncbi:MAG TPA: hypothetical protein VJ652_15200 [Noviherbaspirillum sp.]|nr:hypothetical protein [Noviherbaspirillum sp.]